MISEKFSTNPESFIKFGRGRRIGWRLHMETPVYNYARYINERKKLNKSNLYTVKKSRIINP
jgi:hypothetical protein